MRAWCKPCKTIHEEGAHTRPQPLPSPKTALELTNAPPKEELEVETRERAVKERASRLDARWEKRVKVLEDRIERAVKILRGEE